MAEPSLSAKKIPPAAEVAAQSSPNLGDQTVMRALGLLDTVMAETLGMSLHNAVMTQQNAQMSATAAVTATCAKMLQMPLLSGSSSTSSAASMPQNATTAGPTNSSSSVSSSSGTSSSVDTNAVALAPKPLEMENPGDTLDYEQKAQ